MNKLLVAVSLGAMVLVGGCDNKRVSPAPTAKTASFDPAPTGGNNGLYGASGSAAPLGAAPLDNSLTGSTPTMGETTPPDFVPKAGTAKKTTTVAKAPTAKKTTTAAKSGTAGKTVASAGGKKYTVKKGDTLSSIAKKTYGKVSAIKKIEAANPGMTPNLIKVGQVIILP